MLGRESSRPAAAASGETLNAVLTWRNRICVADDAKESHQYGSKTAAAGWKRKRNAAFLKIRASLADEVPSGTCRNPSEDVKRQMPVDKGKGSCHTAARTGTLPEHAACGRGQAPHHGSREDDAD